jgi:tetratricopeptide (TPR) repeat protein
MMSPRIWLALAWCTASAAMASAPSSSDAPALFAPSTPVAGVEPSATLPSVDLGGEPSGVRRDRAINMLRSSNTAAQAEALTLLQSVVDAVPEDGLARFNLATAAWVSGDLARASREFEACTKRHASLWQGWQSWAQVAELRGNLREAEDALRAGIAANPSVVDLRVSQAALLRRMGKPEQAVEAARAGLEQDKRSLALYDEMGLAWMALSRYDAARFIYELAATKPGYGDALGVQTHAAWLLYLAGDRYVARARLEDLVKRDDTLVEARVYLARILWLDENWTLMLPLLERAATLAPNNAGIQSDLGLTYRGLGQAEPARAAFLKALALDPRDPTPHFNLAMLLGDDLKQYDDALKALRTYLDAGGTDKARAEAMVTAFEKEKSRAEARKKAEEDRARRERDRAARDAAAPAATDGGAASPAPTTPATPAVP